MISLQMILGRVSADGAVVVGKPVSNSSKWIFDVTQDEPGTFEVHLLDFISGKLRPKGICAPHAVPMNESAAKAIIYFPSPDKLTISCACTEPGAAVYRVTVDALHTLMR